MYVWLDFCLGHVFKIWNHCRVPDQFVGLKTMGADMTLPRLQSYLTGAFGTSQEVRTCELMVHPGYMTREVGGCGDGADEFSRSPDREHEMVILGSSGLSHIYTSLNVKLASFKTCVDSASWYIRNYVYEVLDFFLKLIPGVCNNYTLLYNTCIDNFMFALLSSISNWVIRRCCGLLFSRCTRMCRYVLPGKTYTILIKCT